MDEVDGIACTSRNGDGGTQMQMEYKGLLSDYIHVK